MAAFDPEAFVADDGFDPEAFAGGEEGGPETFLDPEKSRAYRDKRRLKNTGPMDKVMADLQQGEHRQDRDLDYGSAASAPVLSAVDRGSLGLFGAALRKLHGLDDTRIGRAFNEAVGADPPEQRLIGRSLKTMQDYRGDHPVLSRYTDTPGYMAGPAAATARAGANIGRQLLPNSPVGSTIVGAGIGGGAIGGAQAATAGGDYDDVVEEMIEGARMGAGFASPLAVAGRAMGAAARGIQGSKGAKARRFIEERGDGARVGPGTPGAGGKFDEMVTKGTDDAAIGQQAEVSAKRGLDMLNEEKRGVLGVAGKRIGRVSQSEEAGQLRDVTTVITKMEDALSELDTSPQARAALKDALEAVKKKQGQGFNADTDNYLLTEADLNKLKRSLDRHARTGISTEEKFHPLREAANEVRAMVNEGPYAEANKIYSRESKHFQESRKLLDIPQRPKTPEEAQSNVNKVKNLIGRPGQNTITAGGQQARLAEFNERHPDIAEEFIKPELLRKRADLSFHLFPQHGGLIDRGHPVLHYLAHGLLHGASGVLPSLAYTNRNAIAARLLYGPSIAAQELEPLLLNEVPLLSAVRNQYGEHR